MTKIKLPRRALAVLAVLTLSMHGEAAPVAPAGQAVEITPSAMFPVVDGSYAPNILRRVDAAGALRATVTAEPAAAFIRGTGPEAVIDGSWATGLGWTVDPAAAAKFAGTVTLDLKEPLLVNKVDIAWAPGATPERWTVAASLDGQKFDVVKEATTRQMLDKVIDVKAFPAANARYLRITALGTSDALRKTVTLSEVRAYLSPLGPPPDAGQGYSLAGLRGVIRAQRGAPDAWKPFGNITTGRTGLSIRGNPEVKKDASYEVDLLQSRPLQGVKLTFDRPGSAWEHGGKIEISAGKDAKWIAAIDMTEPMGTGYYAIDPQFGLARSVRFTNRADPVKGLSDASLVQVEVFAPVREGKANPPVAKVQTKAGQRLSAGVFNAAGRLVRTLAMSDAPGDRDVPLYWDGFDDLGAQAAPGKYEWRTLVNQPDVKNIGSVGDSGNPPYGSTEAMGSVHFVSYDAAGNLYMGTWWMERDGLTVRKTGPGGETIWEANLNGAIALATDGTEVYVSHSPLSSGENQIYRFNAEDGKPLPFPDGRAYLVVGAKRTMDATTLGRSTRDRMTLEPVGGLALEATRLYAGNYVENLVEILDRVSGKKLGQVPVALPAGVAIRKAAANRWDLWVASADSVRLFTSADGLAFKENAAAAIHGGPLPQAVSLNPQGTELAVGDNEDGVVRVYSLAADGKATLARQVGHKAEPGELGDDTFRPGTRWGVALSAESALAVGDAGNRMLRIFDKSGNLVRTSYSEFQPAPRAFDIKPDSHHMLSGVWEYDVNLSGKPKSGPLWHGDGTWRLAANWTPDDNLYFGGSSQRLRLGNGEEYLVFLGIRGGGLAFYHLRNGRMRRSVLVGVTWTGLDQSARRGGRGALWTWRDANGNGKIDWKDPNPEKVGPDQEGEIILPLKTASGWGLRAPGVTLDAEGTIWLANYRNGIAKLPLKGFDDQANPLYDFANPEMVVQSTVAKDGFVPNNLRVSAKGEIYALGFSKNATATNPYMWMGGREIRRYTAAGEPISSFIIPNADTVTSFVLDPIEPDVLYTGNNIGATWEIRAWSKDGLCLGTATPDMKLSGNGGWIDGFTGIDAFTPDGKQRLLYGEDVFHGKSVLFRIKGWNEVKSLVGAVVLKGE